MELMGVSTVVDKPTYFAAVGIPIWDMTGTPPVVLPQVQVDTGATLT